jgi:HEAT repeat protein
MRARVGREYGRGLRAKREDGDLDTVLAALAASATLDATLPLAAHPSAKVRRAMATALSGSADPRAVAALIALSADVDANVRDWATFELGSAEEPGAPVFVDTDAVRQALFARLEDPFDEVRAEAILGLAMRKDRRAVVAIARELTAARFGARAAERFGALVVAAARWAADLALAEALQALRDDRALMETFPPDVREDLDAALDACRGARRPR